MTDPVIKVILNFALSAGMAMALFVLLYVFIVIRPWRRK